jgi:hypothetical protein
VLRIRVETVFCKMTGEGFAGHDKGQDGHVIFSLMGPSGLSSLLHIQFLSSFEIQFPR